MTILLFSMKMRCESRVKTRKKEDISQGHNGLNGEFSKRSLNIKHLPYRERKKYYYAKRQRGNKHSLFTFNS